MRFFLCGIAKDDEEAAETIAHSGAAASLRCEDVRQVWARRVGNVYAVLLSDIDGDEQGVVELSDGRVVLWSGYLGTGDLRAFLDSNLRGSPGQPLLTQVIGGIAAFALIDFERRIVFGWSSQPGVEPLYYSSSKMSNRPLAICAGQPEFNCSYLDWYMSTGYSLDRSTPFKDVYWLMSDEMVRLDVEGGRRLPHPNPSAAYEEMPIRDMVDAGVAALEGCISPLDSFSDIELFLSNGKDSRLLAAALHHCGIGARATTMSLSDRAALSLVRAIAQAAGIQVEERDAGFRVADAHAVLRQTLEQSEGILNCEANVDMVPWPTSFGRQQAIIFGHSHLQKGGLLKGPIESHAHALNMLGRRFDNPLAAEGVRRNVRSFILEWASSKSYRAPEHILYWAAHDFRVTHYLRAHYQRFSALGTPVYPLIDERFARLCGASGMKHKVDESFMYGMIVRMCWQMRDLPTATTRWKFEQESPSPNFPGYELRAVIQSDEAASANSHESVWNSAALIATARDAVLGGSLKDELLGRVEGGMADAVVSWGRRGFYPGAPSRRRARIQLFRMYAATVLCDEVFRDARNRTSALKRNSHG